MQNLKRNDTNELVYRTETGSQTVFPGGSVVKKPLVVKDPPVNARDIRDTDSISGSEVSPGGGHGKPLQHSCLEKSMERGAWGLQSRGLQKESNVTEHTHTQHPINNIENESMVARGERRRKGRVRDFGMDKYTQLYSKGITKKGTGNSAQCYVAAWMEEEFGGEWIHVYVRLSPCAVHLKVSKHC